jgi:CRISPR/Cas system Type II protein with McrA/HNH and RuvC-like nuclease domain
MYKLNSKEHIIDIDHFVPRSIGGPGNIIENLIPISASINRKKSNHVPSKLLDLAKQFGEKKPNNLVVSHDKFYSDRENLNLAKRIVEKINFQTDNELRITYRTIRDFHFPYLSTIKNQ